METQDTPQMSTDKMEEIKSPEALGKQEDLEDLEKEGDEAESDERKNHEGKETAEDEAARDKTAEDRAENPEESADQISQASPVDGEETTPFSPWRGAGGEAFPHRPENISEEDYDAATTLLTAIAEELSAGAISDETLTLLVKSAAYDRDVVAARHEGEVAGRNMRIDEYMTERRKQQDLPDLGRSPAQPRHTLPFTVIGGLSAADRKSIWERGNEKRNARR